MEVFRAKFLARRTGRRVMVEYWVVGKVRKWGVVRKTEAVEEDEAGNAGRGKCRVNGLMRPDRVRIERRAVVGERYGEKRREEEQVSIPGQTWPGLRRDENGEGCGL